MPRGERAEWEEPRSAAAAAAASVAADTPKAKEAAAAASAEWVAASAREKAGELCVDMITWATAQPEYGLAAAGNAEGCGAAEERNAWAPQELFKPSGRAVCFLGEAGEMDEKGKKRMRPSLALTPKQQGVTAQLPSAVRPPVVEAAYCDQRVDWENEIGRAHV